MTRAQRAAIDAHWPRYGLECDCPLDLETVFGRRAPKVLEIGFGMGDVLLELAAAHPERDFIGIEVYAPGIGKLLAGLDSLGVDNVHLIRQDAVEALPFIPVGTLSLILLYFPDPWPKKRHHKRRLVQPAFAELAAGRLESGGEWHVATDDEGYALHIRDVLEATPGLANRAGGGRFSLRPAWRPATKFERRGDRLGHRVWDLQFRREG